MTKTEATKSTKTENTKSTKTESAKSTPAKNTPTIAAKIAQLDAAVDWFYSDEFALDAALDKYKAAAKLAEEIKADLEKLKNEVELVQCNVE